ncbi:MAG: M23 family metallopeptidase [Alphaproteobacteria bacterium]|nr:M23 family metallopeptidase [Alphaproteobacteria bacterium]MDP6516501.1 M23 family metallopeptidase [Alphaproteobacteria bacterium]
MPVICPERIDCHIQNYFDQDAGPGHRDYRCGLLSYPDHLGTDIRVPDLVAMDRGVPVVAAMAGVVRATRDGMADSGTGEADSDDTAGRALGNAVVVGHDGGLTTIYGHLRNGSVVVAEGDRVAAGDILGQMGLSGRTAFPHLHFEVRLGKRPIDPFMGPAPNPDCGALGEPLWSAQALAAMPYVPTGLLGAGFAAAVPTSEAAQAGAYGETPPSRDAPALTFWVALFGAQAGDRVETRLLGPGGLVIAAQSDRLAKPFARWFHYVGKKRRSDSWPPGRYQGEFVLRRDPDGAVVIRIEREVELR